MADDKRIRVSADSSPLQELRQGAQALWNDLTRMETRFKGLAEETIASIQKQIDLLKERNSLTGGLSDGGYTFQPPQSRSHIIDPITGRYTDGRTPGQSMRSTDSVLNKRQLTVLERIYAQVLRIADTIEQSGRNQTNGVLPDGSGGGDNPVPPVPPNPKNPNIRKNKFKFPTSIGGLLGRAGIVGLLAGALGSALGKQAQFDATQYGAENMFQRQNNIGNHWLLNMLTFGISGAKAQEAEVGRMAAARNDTAINDYTSLHNLSYKGVLNSQIGGFFSKNMFRTEKVASPNTMSEATGNAYVSQIFVDWISGTDKAKDVYDPTKDNLREEFVINSDNKNEYHNWASRTLGLNITDYLQKVYTLQRAGVKGSNTSIEDINQLLMAGRIRGLSEDDMAETLKTTRFRNEGGLTGAGVVQAFDSNLQGLYKGRPDADQRIASTLDEYLKQFNRISESILDKAGSVNTESVVRSMTSIQNATGMEGKQLERVQNSLMGVNISQDETTQALLMRTARQINPNGSLSDLQAMIEKMPQDTELQKEFFGQIRDMTGGGEQMRQVLKAVFPQLNMSDIIDAELGEITPEELFKKGRGKGEKYSDQNAAAKVGGAELSSAGTGNRQVVDGIKNILDQSGTSLKEVLNNIEKPIPVMVINMPSLSDSPMKTEVTPEMEAFAKRLGKHLVSTLTNTGIEIQMQ